MTMASSSSNKLPTWVSLWLTFTSVLCAWDAGFVIFRPHSLPGGNYHTFWKPYSLYIEVDRTHKDMSNTFVYAQSLMNVAEIVLNIIALLLNTKNSRHTIALAYTASVMTMWKTVLYMLQYLECVGGGEYHAHSSPLDVLLMIWVPAVVWIGVPLLVMASLWSRLLPGGTDLADGTKQGKKD